MDAISRVLVIIVVCGIFASVSNGEEERRGRVDVKIEAVTSIAKTDDHFICATLDWWPTDKCDYGQCPWGKSGLNNLDLSNTILRNAIKAFGEMRIRVGGSLHDQVRYKVGNSVKGCSNFKRNDDGLFGFTQGCLQMERWDQLHCLFNQTGEQRAKSVPMAAAVDQWKETEIGKTRKKYEKLTEKIVSWEDKKRKKAKQKLHRTERGIEKIKLKAIERFKDDNERIEIIVASARAHAYESRMKEELKVKEKANLMRTTGRKPSTCL